MKLIKPSQKTLQVRKPNGSLLAPDGEPLALTAFWLRRQGEGDVIVSDFPVPETPVADAEAPAVKPTKAEK
ncbi:DUF2635 domain-containing protein [Serratia proteamaculans]|uniref:DUF2635 domain-containing protein n=1 Tax=Serratia proteamaculans TaxID=28151 RepID=UPI001F5D5341|nr:DUF2635 domain-containing protein [Serratia proteamaculans]